MPTDRNQLQSIRLTVLLIFTFLAFFRFWAADYVNWDDPVLVLDNPWMTLPFWEALRTFFTRPIAGDYIPLPLLTHWLEIHWAGFNPLVHHGTNLLLHLINISLLFQCLKRFRISGSALWIITLIFAIHPLQVEPVMWISDRKSLLNAAFMLLSLNYFQKNCITAYTLAFSVANLAKTSSIFLPILLFYWDFKQLPDLTFKQRLRRHLPAFIVMIAFSFIRYAVMEDHLGFMNDAVFNADRLARLPVLIFAVLGHYLIKFLIPYPLLAIYPEFQDIQSWVPHILTSIAFTLFAVGFVFLLKRKANGDDVKLSRFFLGWFFLFLLPVLHIIPRGNFANDRYMYLPIIGLTGFIAIAAKSFSLKVRKGVETFFGCLILMLLFLLTFHQVSIWENSYGLWENVTRSFPRSRIAWNNLAAEQRRLGLNEKALLSLNQAILDGVDQVIPMSVLFRNRGDIYADAKYPQTFNRDLAVQNYEFAIKTAVRPIDLERAQAALRSLASETASSAPSSLSKPKE